jgi:predicted nucleic acid-binding protein
VIGIDTNILIYARVATAPFHAKAVAFVEQLAAELGVVMAELVLVELYMALRNPAILQPRSMRRATQPGVSTFARTHIGPWRRTPK